MYRLIKATSYIKENMSQVDMDLGPYDDSFYTTQHCYGAYINMIKNLLLHIA